jgi:hypothetical protein
MAGVTILLLVTAALHGGDAVREAALTDVLGRAGLVSEGQALPAGDAALLERALASDAFVHAAAGPLDVYVQRAGKLGNEQAARKLLDQAVAGLAPTVALFEREFGREQGVLSGRRFPLLLAGEEGFAGCVALLDHCDTSGWKPQNAVWTSDAPAQIVVRTWDVQALNLDHPDAAAQGKVFLEHGLGYYTLAHLTHRLLRQGSWGTVPPWLAQGLIDELDIEAYGRSWVGGESWESSTSGWHREGWSGFVPKGMQPPAPVTGPPADLATTVKRTGDSWTDRDNSGTRHWTDLLADRKSAAPASFAFMARNESFLPRDRAYARCALDLMLFVTREQEASLLELLDRVSETPANGMPTAEPLPVLFAKALGGVPEVERLEALGTRELLDELGRSELAGRIGKLGGEGALALSDHRAQAEWLYRQSVDSEARGKLFDLFLEVEYWQQLREWEAIGQALDRATEAALEAGRSYPKRAKEQAKVSEAFRAALRS